MIEDEAIIGIARDGKLLHKHMLPLVEYQDEADFLDCLQEVGKELYSVYLEGGDDYAD